MDSNSPRTNNHIEGWHNKLKRIAKKSHPNMYEIIEKNTIQKIYSKNTEVSIAQLDVGCQTPKRPKKYIDKDNKIEILKDRLRQDSITQACQTRSI